MRTSILFRSWWVILIQGILMIILSIYIFNSPGIVLATLAFWLGIIVFASGLYGMIAYFAASKEDRETGTILRSIAMVVIGLMMISKMLLSMIAITIAFGTLVSWIGLVLISGSWNGRKFYPMWWISALLGIIILITGIKSMLDVETAAEKISSLIAISVLLSGIGLILFAFLKKKVVSTIKSKLQS